MKLNRMTSIALAAVVGLLYAAPAFADYRDYNRYNNDSRFTYADNRDNDHNRDNDRNWRGNRDHDRRGGQDFVWRGSVDDIVTVFVRGDRSWTVVKSGNRVEDVDTGARRPLPAASVDVRVNLQDGRGRVYMVQQPSKRNGYTAAFRIEDRDPGRDNYRVTLDW
ncbi:MAG TPA: hypothetical protein VGK19_06825 [Capsulimonadaceae bacterium]|jgi:hypothetical protein